MNKMYKDLLLEKYNLERIEEDGLDYLITIRLKEASDITTFFETYVKGLNQKGASSIQCPAGCGAIPLSVEQREFTLEGKKVMSPCFGYKCEKCGEEFTTTESDTFSLVLIKAAAASQAIPATNDKDLIAIASNLSTHTVRQVIETEEGELQPCCANSCDGFKCESGSVHLIDSPNKEEGDDVASDNNSNGASVASHSSTSGNSIEQYLKQRIKELNQADAKFCHDRWDNPAADSFLKMLSREESNKVTFARQELETVLKMLNQ
jgi:hypothetical protein